MVAALDPGSRFPSIALQDESGRPALLPAGEVLYGFFKTTCPTSELAWPYLDRIRRIAQGGSLSVLAVSQDDPETTSRFNREMGLALPTVYDPPPWRASEALGMTSVPTLFLVGKDGAVRETVVGFQKAGMERLARRAAELAGRSDEGLFRPGDNVPPIRPG